MDGHEERLERLREKRETLTAGAERRERERLDEEIAEAEGNSLTGSADPRTDTRIEGERANRYVATMMSHGPHGVSARRIRADAVSSTKAALARLRLACRFVRSTFAPHAGVRRGPRRPGRVRVARARRGPARAAPARPRPRAA